MVSRKKYSTIENCVADWVALEGLFGSVYCFFCNVTWSMIDGDSIPPNALLHIQRKNIRICLFHAYKRIFSTLYDCLRSNQKKDGKEVGVGAMGK